VDDYVMLMMLLCQWLTLWNFVTNGYHVW